MERRNRFGVVVPALGLAISLAVPVSAQDSSIGTQPQPKAAADAQAGQTSKEWASDAYEKAKTAISDSLITLKVKIAMLEQRMVAGENIHVSTQDGVVTLNGRVHSSLALTQAEETARSTSGVREVANKLRIITTRTAN